MTKLQIPALTRTMRSMNPKAIVQVDFHLCPDGQHTLALASDVTPGAVLAAGDVVAATDGDVTHLAVVDSLTDNVVSLVILWDATVPAA